jgi:hypothetical protein
VDMRAVLITLTEDSGLVVDNILTPWPVTSALNLQRTALSPEVRKQLRRCLPALRNLWCQS